MQQATVRSIHLDAVQSSRSGMPCRTPVVGHQVGQVVKAQRPGGLEAIADATGRHRSPFGPATPSRWTVVSQLDHGQRSVGLKRAGEQRPPGDDPPVPGDGQVRRSSDGVGVNRCWAADHRADATRSTLGQVRHQSVPHQAGLAIGRRWFGEQRVVGTEQHPVASGLRPKGQRLVQFGVRTGG
jgi:hypothetical protein